MSVSSRFINRHAIVTGGTSGIGQSIAEALADEGAQVIAVGLNAQESTRENIRLLEVDVADADSVEQLVGDCDELHHLAFRSRDSNAGWWRRIGPDGLGWSCRVVWVLVASC